MNVDGMQFFLSYFLDSIGRGLFFGKTPSLQGMYTPVQP